MLQVGGLRLARPGRTIGDHSLSVCRRSLREIARRLGRAPLRSAGGIDRYGAQDGYRAVAAQRRAHRCPPRRPHRLDANPAQGQTVSRGPETVLAPATDQCPAHAGQPGRYGPARVSRDTRPSIPTLFCKYILLILLMKRQIVGTMAHGKTSLA